MKVSRCIHWMHYEQLKNCFWVRKQVAGTLYQKTFLVSKYGGKQRALAAATKWLDKIEKKHKAKRGYKIFRIKKKRPAPIGVSYHDYAKKITSKNGHVYVYRCRQWIALICPTPTTTLQRAFSVAKYGFSEAKQMAIRKRKQLEKEYYS